MICNGRERIFSLPGWPTFDSPRTRPPHSSASCAEGACPEPAEGWEPRTSIPYSFAHNRSPVIPANAGALAADSPLPSPAVPTLQNRQAWSSLIRKGPSRYQSWASPQGNCVQLWNCSTQTKGRLEGATGHMFTQINSWVIIVSGFPTTEKKRP